MKFFVSIFLTAVFAFALGLYFDWWSIAIAAFVVAVCVPQKPWLSALSGFVALLLLWGGYSIFINQQNNGLLAAKVAAILPLKGNIPLLLLITAFVAALVGGFAALTGSYVFKPNTSATHQSLKSIAA